MKTLSIAVLGGLLALLLATTLAHGEQTNNDMKAYQNVEERLARIGEIAEAQEITEIGHAINQLPLGDGSQADSVMEKKKLSLWIKLLGEIDSAIDPSFDASDVPSLSVAPPSNGRIVYNSGTDPKTIKDPEVRKQYEDAIKANQAKAKRHAQQIALRRIRDEFVPKAAAFVQKQFSGSRSPVVKEVLQSEFPEAEKRARVQSLITIKGAGL